MPSAIPHIFVIEDEEMNRTIIEEILNDMPDKYLVETALDGEEAWAKLQNNPEQFDVILLDRMMPGMDGLEVLKNIKSHPILTHLPVILQTSLASKHDVADGMKAGAYYYLTKPFDVDVLQSVIRTAVRDRMEYRRMTTELSEHFSTMSCLSKASFCYRTVQEAKNLAILLANAYANTEKAVVGLSELLVNAVEHGNLAITYKEKSDLMESGTLMDELNRRLSMDEYKSRIVDVQFRKLETGIEVVITDEGKGFDWLPYLTMSPERAMDNHGRGIAMAALMSFDKLEYLGCGNSVKATINNE